MTHKMKHHRPDKLISASEVACFAYCPEQWRLQYGLRLPAGNRQALRAGTRFHRRLSSAERWAGALAGAGRLLGVLALCGLALWLLWRFR